MASKLQAVWRHQTVDNRLDLGAPNVLLVPSPVHGQLLWRRQTVDRLPGAETSDALIVPLPVHGQLLSLLDDVSSSAITAEGLTPAERTRWLEFSAHAAVTVGAGKV
jgi:hypothetical protein